MLAIFASNAYAVVMNSKHRRTLAAVFTEPVSGTIDWTAVESLLLAAGARLIEGRGSRVRFEKDGKVATFHRPRTLPRKRSDTRCAMPATFWNGSG